MIDRSISDSVATLRLNYGKASALDIELVDAIALAVAENAADDNVRAVILTGTGSIFSAGVDLFRLTSAGREYAERFLPALSRMLLDLFAFPKPLIVAVNGHAIAGGCLFALAGDYRLMAQGNGRIGIPELLVGVAFPPSVIEAVRFALPPQQLQSLLYTGKTVLPDEALQRGIVDEVVDAATLPARAEEMARHFASLPPRAFALAKKQLRETAVDRAKHYANELDGDVIDFWSSDETLDRIREYLAKTVKK
ncbi:MAG TPA: enoyl-CoA hydratase/isomerase family protein [Thermoanaerobaculia bacterium]